MASPPQLPSRNNKLTDSVPMDIRCLLCYKLTNQQNSAASPDPSLISHLWNYLYHQNVKESLLPSSSSPTNQIEDNLPKLTFTISTGSPSVQGGTANENDNLPKICEDCSIQLNKLDTLHQQLESVKNAIDSKMTLINRMRYQQSVLGMGSPATNPNDNLPIPPPPPPSGLTLAGCSIGKKNISQALTFLKSICDGMTSMDTPPIANQVNNKDEGNLPSTSSSSVIKMMEVHEGGATTMKQPLTDDFEEDNGTLEDLDGLEEIDEEWLTIKVDVNPSDYFVEDDCDNLDQGQDDEESSGQMELNSVNNLEEDDHDHNDQVSNGQSADLGDPLKELETYQPSVPLSPSSSEKGPVDLKKNGSSDDESDFGVQPKKPERKKKVVLRKRAPRATRAPREKRVPLKITAPLEKRAPLEKKAPVPLRPRAPLKKIKRGVCPQKRCPDCRKMISAPNFPSHQRIHTGERPYKCEFCDKAFAKANTLLDHRRAHLGVTPYVCEYCNKGFVQLTSLKFHRTVNHTGEMDHECEICGKKFVFKSQLRNHLEKTKRCLMKKSKGKR